MRKFLFLLLLVALGAGAVMKASEVGGSGNSEDGKENDVSTSKKDEDPGKKPWNWFFMGGDSGSSEQSDQKEGNKEKKEGNKGKKEGNKEKKEGNKGKKEGNKGKKEGEPGNQSDRVGPSTDKDGENPEEEKKDSGRSNFIKRCASAYFGRARSFASGFLNLARRNVLENQWVQLPLFLIFWTIFCQEYLGDKS